MAGREIDALFAAAKRRPRDYADRMSNAGTVNTTQQMDLLVLPQDPDRSRYALVVVDIATRRVAARPIRDKTAATVAVALRDIYKNDAVLRPPQRMECDDGAEFHGSTASYLRAEGTAIRYGEPGRHKQQGMVERVNGLIGRAIMMAQSARELETRKPNREWVSELPGIVAEINRRIERKPPPLPTKIPPPANAIDAAVLPIGTVVRRKNDRPTGVLGAVLHGTQRAGDPTYETRKRAVVSHLIRPGSSIRYFLEGLPHATYGRYELSVVAADEQPTAPRAKPVKAAAAAAVPALRRSTRLAGQS